MRIEIVFGHSGGEAHVPESIRRGDAVGQTREVKQLARCTEGKGVEGSHQEAASFPVDRVNAWYGRRATRLGLAGRAAREPNGR